MSDGEGRAHPVITHSCVGYNALRFEAGKDNLFSQRDDELHLKLRNKMASGVSLNHFASNPPAREYSS